MKFNVKRVVPAVTITVATAAAILAIATPGSADTAGPIIGVGSVKCLDVPSGSGNGTRVDIWTCNGSAGQNWTLRDDGTIRVLGKCLDVTGGVNANGTAVQIWSCGGGNLNQRWTYDSTTRTLKNTGTGRCLDVIGASTANGALLQIWACHGPGNQRWNLPSAPAPTPTPTTAEPPAGTTPVGINGQLHVCGVKLCNRYNRPIQLRGMSTHGIQWYPQCVNSASLDALANDWKADVLRISMYVQEEGYETDPRLFTDRVDSFIDLASARGMYVIVDWHMLDPGDPNFNLSKARTFFAEIAARHAGKVNILYEVANEPSGVSWAAIKSYAEQIIPVIRAQDPDGVVLVGTRAWSSLGISEDSNETEVTNNKVNASNIMYTFHFYAASHGSEYFEALSRAADKIPMFVTEFGTQNYSGEGANNFIRAQAYLDLMDTKQISWTNWNFSDDERSGAVFTEGTCGTGPYSGTSRLKQAGVWVRDHIRTADNFPVA